MKPLKRKNYGSIPHLSNSKLGEGDYYIEEGQEKILTEKKRDKEDTILVFEKYDGSNVGIAKKEGKIFALNRAGYEAHTSPFRQHHEFANWVEKHAEKFNEILNEGERIAGEWLLQAHGLKYNLKQEPIVFFDFFTDQNRRRPFDFLKQFDVPLPRLLHNGDAIKVEELVPILNEKTESIYPDNNPEGMIYRVERKGRAEFLAKWVRSDFEPGKYMMGRSEDDLVWNARI